MTSRLACCLLLPAFAVGCTVQPPSSLGTSRSEIVGGTTDTGDPGVVLVIAQMPSSQNAALCTGEVVSPHVVMTAAHCVSPVTVGTGNQFAVFTGNDINQAANSDFHTVQATHYDTAFDAIYQSGQLQNGHDIGVVITTNPLSITPLPMNETPIDQSMVGMPVRLVGYGIDSGTDTSGTSAGIKRETMTTLSDFDSLLLKFNDPNHITCEGDSGGPAFMKLDGQNEVIAGITSFGDQGCMVFGDDTRVDDYAKTFVQPYIDMYDPPPPDMAMPPASDGGFVPGQVGASCMSASDCNSGICATQGMSGYCTTACDPTDSTSCPSDTHCGTIDGAHYCQPNKRGGGCSAALGSAPTGWAGLGLLLCLLALGLGRRRFARHSFQ